MPRYVLKCTVCDYRLREREASVRDRIKIRCPKCDGKTEIDWKRMKTTFHLKGTGWERDGYS